jgi:hypothetical protein
MSHLASRDRGTAPAVTEQRAEPAAQAARPAPARSGQILFLADIATLAGVTYTTARRYHTQAQTARKAIEAGEPVPGRWRVEALLPPPVDYQAGTGRPRPYWTKEVLRPWLAIRQGPGRPRNDGNPPQTRLTRPRRRPGPKPVPVRRQKTRTAPPD